MELLRERFIATCTANHLNCPFYGGNTRRTGHIDMYYVSVFVYRLVVVEVFVLRPALLLWRPFLRVRGFLENVRQFIPRLRFFFFLKWRLARAN